MSYLLGVDLGTTFSAAAVAADGRVYSFGLANDSHVVPSVVALADDGELLIGEAAARFSRTEPEASAREFKRRFGDTTPYLLRGTPMSAELLTGELLRWIVERVSEREGQAPAGIRLTHPANWGQYQIDLLGEAARLVDVGPVSFMTEPEAAAVHYSSLQRIPDGATVAVYDLGGGTFDASVLRRQGDGFTTIGRPEGIARLGGIDFDEAVFGHVRRSLGDAWNQLDPSDPSVIAGVARLRRDCVDAKEDLSARTTTAIDVLLPGLTTEIRLTRAEFEGLIARPIEETITALGRALDSAAVQPADLDRVLLVGGSSRVPLVSQMVSAALERPVAIDAHPKYAVSMGAAIALEMLESPGLVPTPLAAPVVPAATPVPTSEAEAAPPPPVPLSPLEESLRVPLPAPEPETPAATVAPEPEVAAAPPAPQPSPPRSRAPFPSTAQTTAALVAGVLVLVAAVAWIVFSRLGAGGISADQVALMLASRGR